MNLFETRQVTTFDKSTFKIGYFVTFCYMEPMGLGEEWIEGTPINAIIYHVMDQSLKLSDTYGNVYELPVTCIEGSPAYQQSGKRIKILGIMKDAITKE